MAEETRFGLTTEQVARVMADIAALKEACQASHEPGPGAATMCICGAGGGGSAACSALATIRDAIRHRHMPGTGDWIELIEDLL